MPRSDLQKLLGIILLPIYIVVILVAFVLWLLVVITHQEKRLFGRAVRRLGFFSEKFYYKYYGDVDERDN